ncbi:alpha amylase C-terminal domain-containing protein, partial [Spirulina sp. 06S082]|uniref:alpha amylase C-terminal domain-containing protein n=1 Tax=Spirulina sp. 06S082 TaxID=3110248 RepID=UPI002B1EA018
NSDAGKYGGSNMGNLGGKWEEEWSFHDKPYSLDLCLPPLGVIYLKLDRQKTAEALQNKQNVLDVESEG